MTDELTDTQIRLACLHVTLHLEDKKNYLRRYLADHPASYGCPEGSELAQMALQLMGMASRAFKAEADLLAAKENEK
jgi:hypothetical protein